MASERSVYACTFNDQSGYISPKSDVSSLAESDLELTLSVKFVIYNKNQCGENKRKKITMEFGGNTTVYEALQNALKAVNSLNEVKEIAGRAYYAPSRSEIPVELQSDEFDSVTLQELAQLSPTIRLIFDDRHYVAMKHGIEQNFQFWIMTK